MLTLTELFGILWDQPVGFNPTAPDQPGFAAFAYHGA